MTPAVRALAGRADCICSCTLAQRNETIRATCRATLDAAPQALALLDINLRKGCYNETTVRESLSLANVKLNGVAFRL
ncbi:MAG: hypothetical protein KGY81_04525 [Phycisphaerae bacterium]|nr:hypothetical protein [Phycisphaerae bacterium]